MLTVLWPLTALAIAFLHLICTTGKDHVLCWDFSRQFVQEIVLIYLRKSPKSHCKCFSYSDEVNRLSGDLPLNHSEEDPTRQLTHGDGTF